MIIASDTAYACYHYRFCPLEVDIESHWFVAPKFGLVKLEAARTNGGVSRVVERWVLRSRLPWP